jgi:CRISPR-associated protein Cas1
MPQLGFQQVVGYPSLEAAWSKVAANNGGPGVDGVDIARFSMNVRPRLLQLEQALQAGMYRPAPLRRIELAAPGGRVRVLSIPVLADRIAQTAVARALVPIAEGRFLEGSFGYRPGRGVCHAAACVRQGIDAGLHWVFDADVQRFFDSVPHKQLLDTCRAWIVEPSLYGLACRWIEQGGVSAGRGIAQGSPISPLLANIYMHALDLAFAGEALSFIRYADDFIVLCADARAAARASVVANETLANLGLALHPDKTRVHAPEDPFQFLGLRFEARSTGATPVVPRPLTVQQDAVASSALVTGVPPQAKASMARANDTESVSAFGGEDESAILERSRVRTLYLMEQRVLVRRSGERLIVRAGDETRLNIHARSIELVVAIGNIGFTAGVMHLLFLHNVPLAYLSMAGTLLGMADSGVSQPIALHRAQFEAGADRMRALEIARQFVGGKIGNAIAVLRRYARNRPEHCIAQHLDVLRQMRMQAAHAASLDVLRGCEGFASRSVYAGMRDLLCPSWQFKERNRRPPRDPVNSLLSFGYTLLFNNVYALVRARGLHPYAGFLHRERPGHPALVSDLMEEFRPIVVDALVLRLLLAGTYCPTDFVQGADGACILAPPARVSFVHAFEARMRKKLEANCDGEPLDCRRAIERQAERLCAVLRGKATSYAPFRIR